MNPIRIESFDSPMLDLFARLSENQLKHYYEPEEGVFMAESAEVILRALDQGYEPLSLLVEHSLSRDPLTLRLLRRVQEAPVYEADYEVLRRLTGFPMTRGALCAMRRKPLHTVHEIIKDAHRIVVLDRVMNPTNVGSMFRSAAALGMDAVLLTKGSSDPLYRRSIRVSMGTVFQIPWTFMEREAPYISLLKENGFSCVAMALRKDTILLEDPRLKQENKLAILMGSEKEGLTEETLDLCDYTVKIPMSYGVDSLNVAAAAAIAFFELNKRQ